MAALALLTIAPGTPVDGDVATDEQAAGAAIALPILRSEALTRPMLRSERWTPTLHSAPWTPAAQPSGDAAQRGSDTATPEATEDEAERDDGSTLVAHAVTPVIAHATPDAFGAVVATFNPQTERGGPTVFRVVDDTVDGWVEVQLPVRPNGTTGWVRAESVDLTRNPYRITIDAEAHTMTIHRLDELVVSTEVAIGTGDTPTPRGEFYLIELLRSSDPDGIYGPYAYGLSGFSDTLRSFNGGQGVIGIHGTDSPELLGTDVSHGCVRVDNDVITELTSFLPLGTPVTIA